MNSAGRNILIVIVMASLVIIAITLMSDVSATRDSAYLYSSYNTKARGTHAFYTLLRESGFHTARLRKDFRARELAQQKNLIISIAPADTLGYAELDTLRQRVADGSTALFFYSHFTGRLLNLLGIEYEIFQGDSVITLQQPAAHVVFLDSLIVPTPEDSSSQKLSVRFYSDSTAYTVLYGQKNNHAIIEMTYGSGSFIFFHSPEYVSNEFLASGQQANALVRMIQYTAADEYRAFDKIYFDEYHQGFREYESFISLFDQGAVKLGLMIALLAAALWVYSGSKRFGRPVPVRNQPVRSSLTHVESVKRVYQRARANRLVLKIWRRWFLQFLYDRYKTGSETKLAQILANRYNLPAESVLKLFHETEQKIHDAETHVSDAPVQKREVAISDGDLFPALPSNGQLVSYASKTFHRNPEKKR